MALSIVSSYAQALVQRLRTWRNARRRTHEFHPASTSETQRILRDVDLYMNDMATVSRGASGRVDLLDQRLTELRLDPSYLKLSEPDLYRDLQRVCLQCTSWRRCARDLDRADVQVGLEKYCTNAHAIDQFLVGEAMKPQRP